MTNIDYITEQDVANDRNLCDRLGLAWVRLNQYKWDNILGDEPINYKTDCGKYMNKIEYLMGDKAPMLTSWYWWKYYKNEFFDNWINWYMWGQK